MTERTIQWQRSDVPGSEWCRLRTDATGARLEGTVVLAWDGHPWRIAYWIELDDAGRTRRVTIEATGAAVPGDAPREVRIELMADGRGRWERDGAVVIDDHEAIDCDLGFSPSTNTLPIRRLGLAVGETRAIAVAWILFPSFDVVLGRQSYERLAERTWRYRSTGFEADLTVDADGLVDAYDEWRAVARA